jgi:hypothetical protein
MKTRLFGVTSVSALDLEPLLTNEVFSFHKLSLAV